jgi:hypothetical protein
LRRFKNLLGGLHIRLRLRFVFHNRGSGHCLEGCLRLFVEALAFVSCGGEIGDFALSHNLAGLHVIAAIDQYAFDGRADFGRRAGLIDGVQHRVRSHDTVDRTLAHRFNLHGCGRFGFRRFLLRPAAGCQQHQTNAGQNRSKTNSHKVPISVRKLAIATR